MSKKTFNPKDWTNPTQNNNSTNDCKGVLNTPLNNNPNTDIEEITKRIEAAAADIAPNYADWRDLGFALADALGESGRSYYHRLSRFYSGYAENETDKQYNNCLKAHGHGVTIKTLYHLAKTAGVDIAIFPKVVQGERRGKTRFDYSEPQPTLDISKYPNCQNGNLETLEISAKTKRTQERPKSFSNVPKSSAENTELLQENTEKTPTFPEIIYNNLPDFLQQVTAKATSAEDKDLLLLGSLVVISACLPNVFGNYDERRVYPNLFLFLTASASAGKGRLTLCRKLVYPIHKALRDRYKVLYDTYKQEKAMYNSAKKDQSAADEPQEPPMLALLMPANSSATAFFQILNDNNGAGLMFETEGDTLAQTFKSEHGNFSDGFRKAFHHETISYLRRKDREFVELENPRLSALLSGTPKQVSALIPNAENGLFSRFIFYFMNIKPVWKDVFANSGDQTLDLYFKDLGEYFHCFHNQLKQQQEMRFCLTVLQQEQFNAYFAQAQIQFLALYGDDYIATVRRLGLITFRIAMILTVLRLMRPLSCGEGGGRGTTPLICTDTDFNSSLEIVKILVQHAATVFDALPAEQETPTTNNPRMALFQSLPPQFDKQTYSFLAAQLQIPESTANKWLMKFVSSNLVTKQAHGVYSKKDS